MQLIQIILSAMRQLEEDPADVAEVRDLFASYANQAYRIITTQYVHPREKRVLLTDAHGCASMMDDSVRHVILITDSEGRNVPFEVAPDGLKLLTGRPDAALTALCEITFPDLVRDDDEPQTPLASHPAMADYICYCYLSNGNLAKQSRAGAFLARFNQQCALLLPQSRGSVTHVRNLYAASDIRNYRQ